MTDPIERAKQRDAARTEPDDTPAPGFLVRQNAELKELTEVRDEIGFSRRSWMLSELQAQRLKLAQDRSDDCSRCGKSCGSLTPGTNYKLCADCVKEIKARDAQEHPGTSWWIDILSKIAKDATIKTEGRT